jgi:hypothetical protein
MNQLVSTWRFLLKQLIDILPAFEPDIRHSPETPAVVPYSEGAASIQRESKGSIPVNY